jgi:hypothetical protein
MAPVPVTVSVWAPASEPVLEQASVQTVELVLVAVLGPASKPRA